MSNPTRREELRQKHPEKLTDDELIEYAKEYMKLIDEYTGNPIAFDMMVMDEIYERGLTEEALPDEFSDLAE